MTMPPLPKPADRTRTAKDGQWDNWFDEEQMLDYAAAVRAATIEECANVCEEMSKVKANDEWEAGMAYGQQGCAAAIRALKDKP